MTNISEPSGWQVRGSAAENYERYLVPAIFASWVPDLLEAAALREGHRVLDVACGTGIVARGALVEDVATILAEHQGEEGISFPMHSQIVTARR